MIRLAAAAAAVLLVLLATSTIALAQATQPAQTVPATQPSSAAPAAVDPSLKPLDILQGRTDQGPGAANLLGEPFQSQSAGIAFRPPAGMTQVRVLTADDLVSYADRKRGWTVTLSRKSLPDPVPLDTWTDSDTGKRRAGLLQITVDQLKNTYPTGEILRQDVVTIGPADVGMIVMRYTSGTARQLTQQAIICTEDNQRQYYVLSLTTPGSEHVGPDQADPGEELAVRTFGQMLDSVDILDRSAIRDDQVRRAIATRALFVNWTPDRIKQAMVPEQWLRVIRNGKDVGYTYVVEMPGKEIPDKSVTREQIAEMTAQLPGPEGVLVGIRSRFIGEENKRRDAETWLFMTLDRAHETWSSLTVDTIGGEQARHATEFGASDRQVDPRGRQLGIDVREKYTLNVSYIAQSGTLEPVTRELPVFYIPTAAAHLLPRLLPLHEPKKFMFAVYVSERREVMLRYVDVGPEGEYAFAGQRITAVPVKDRIGLEGSVTTHYLTLDGKYLGSSNIDTKTTVIPTDAQTLQALWKDAQLTQPAPVGKSGRQAPKQQEQ